MAPSGAFRRVGGGRVPRPHPAAAATVVFSADFEGGLPAQFSAPGAPEPIHAPWSRVKALHRD